MPRHYLIGRSQHTGRPLGTFAANMDIRVCGQLAEKLGGELHEERVRRCQPAANRVRSPVSPMSECSCQPARKAVDRYMPHHCQSISAQSKLLDLHDPVEETACAELPGNNPQWTCGVWMVDARSPVITHNLASSDRTWLSDVWSASVRILRCA